MASAPTRAHPSCIATGARVLLLSGVIGAVAACGSSSTSSGGTSAAQSPGASGQAVQVRSGSLGTHLTDRSGRSLYMFAADSATKSACTAACLTYWPPFTAPARAGSGVASAGLGTVHGNNGARQITYRGHPLYYFAGDTAPGQTNGQGSTLSGARWWLLSPAGKPITGTGSSSGSSGASSSSSGGYGY